MGSSVKEWGLYARLLARLSCWAAKRLIDRYEAQVTNFNGKHLVIRDHRGHVKATSMPPKKGKPNIV